MKLVSLRGRLLAAVIVAQLLLAAGLVWAGTAFTHRQLRLAFDAALNGRAAAIAALVRYPETGPGLRFDTTRVPPPVRPQEPPLYLIRSGATPVAGSIPSAIALPAPGAAAHYWNFSYRGVPYRGLVLSHLPVLDTEEHMSLPLPRLTVYYAAPTSALEQQTVAAGVAIAAVSLVLLALTCWYAAWRIRRELEPLDELAQQAAAISPQHWSFTPPARAVVAEVQPLIAALERMLERLQAAHRQQLTFLADTAHHLKTPVAIVKSTQQTLLQRPRAESEYRAAAEATLQDTERLELLLQRMLRLARLDAEQDGQPAARCAAASAELGATLQGALERARPLAQAHEIELRSRGLDSAAAVGAEAEDLEQAWVNLLENAILHSPRGAAVELACTVTNGRGPVVTVRDHGAGIPAEQMPFLFARFHRGPESQGFGLGLAIARAVVEAAGGTIRAESSAEGTVLRVQLPVAEAPK